MPKPLPVSLPETFTPVYDPLLRELRAGCAMVYGVIWRYCQMEENTCRASLETLAAHSGMSRSSVIRHIKILVGQAYITDLTPDLKHAPHTYVIGRQAGVPIDAPIPEDPPGGHRQVVQEFQNDTGGVTQSHPRSDWGSPQE